MGLVRSFPRSAWEYVVGGDVDEQDLLRRGCMSKMLGSLNISFFGFVGIGVTFVRESVRGAY